MYSRLERLHPPGCTHLGVPRWSSFRKTTPPGYTQVGARLERMYTHLGTPRWSPRLERKYTHLGTPTWVHPRGGSRVWDGSFLNEHTQVGVPRWVYYLSKRTPTWGTHLGVPRWGLRLDKRYTPLGVPRWVHPGGCSSRLRLRRSPHLVTPRWVPQVGVRLDR